LVGRTTLSPATEPRIPTLAIVFLWILPLGASPRVANGAPCEAHGFALNVVGAAALRFGPLAIVFLWMLPLVWLTVLPLARSNEPRARQAHVVAPPRGPYIDWESNQY
jgi:hypothetical protein